MDDDILEIISNLESKSKKLNEHRKEKLSQVTPEMLEQIRAEVEEYYLKNEHGENEKYEQLCKLAFLLLERCMWVADIEIKKGFANIQNADGTYKRLTHGFVKIYIVPVASFNGEQLKIWKRINDISRNTSLSLDKKIVEFTFFAGEWRN